MTFIAVRNPRTGELDYQIDDMDEARIGAAVSAAREAQRAWAQGGLEYRIKALLAWADELEKNCAQVVEALSVDTARHRISAEELGAVIHFIHGFCEHAPTVLATPFRKLDAHPDVVFKVTYAAYPVVGVISPWNFPLVLSFIDAIPALVAGAAVIVKPSEVTPRFIEPLRRTIAAVPALADIITLVTGGAATGAALVAQSDAVVFTGSVPTGQKIAAAAAAAFIPAYLELGGKDAAVVLAGSDVRRAATSILRSALYNSGQVCYAIERVYAHESLYDALVRELCVQAAALKRSHVAGDGGHYGPMIFEKQADIIDAQLDDALRKGASIVLGGKSEKIQGAVWIDPTIVTNVDHTMTLMTEETFGPVVPVMRFSDDTEAERLMNDSMFGLSGAVFGPDTHTAGDFATKMEAGGVSINDTELPRVMMFDGEKTAFKKSGMGGSRYGATSIMRYVRKRALLANEGEVASLDKLAEVAG
ncbi:aldehyde dehydrogenase family protein [bacterium M00.F.Ca.ET.228.01.1.1]|uniref:aldehyde dehydrogenase family protein n=1 Tax=Paraburkholderia phenoliruptrix TaxID=252970 RepID=UPI0010921700|nr:aldehyde dehydrogenase family protein [Paraburkholderia phenoliruptrix]TGP47364.1 aldehyde dehydrogenase family protein [bacterium M00.F.Ca.ET.228.01.1.1]TGS05156.1 aldehyde dehydrogenase family protein [bacterium M00.F.Ca.ET.191.01.1.1]TGU10092.1 aldehyde dehydrogenase family protein [bacterium M00.F.Ca.ET.155.01.1.1]MBW0449636.1 aldehyde dehydrogenase family protein [Paraburkholderia phenoliruptrix]MBW9101254.1 aldehyde dehydrogenase family protein [Paraburkholderia phenoliruptrix]